MPTKQEIWRELGRRFGLPPKGSVEYEKKKEMYIHALRTMDISEPSQPQQMICQCPCDCGAREPIRRSEPVARPMGSTQPAVRQPRKELLQRTYSSDTESEDDRPIRVQTSRRKYSDSEQSESESESEVEEKPKKKKPKKQPPPPKKKKQSPPPKKSSTTKKNKK